MRAGIFMWAGLLFIGLVSIGTCYPNDNEDASDELSKSSRSLKWGDLSDDNDEMRGLLKLRKRTCNSGCSPSCRSDQLCIAPNQCVCPNGQFTSPCPIQSHDLCAPADTAGVKPVLSITFGSGTSQYSKASPSSLGFHTSYSQIANKRLEDGNFAIVNAVPADYTAWLGGGLDHTQHCSVDGVKGYMMVVGARSSKHELLRVTADSLCIGLRYEFSVYIANIVKKGSNILKPNILIEAFSGTGDKHLIAVADTGDMPEQDTLTWVKYGMSFITTSPSVIVTFTSNTLGGGGNDYAIDDITLVSCSPRTNGVCHKNY